MRALSKVALLRPPTPDAQLAVMRAHVRASAKDRPGVYRMLSSDGGAFKRFLKEGPDFSELGLERSRESARVVEL